MAMRDTSTPALSTGSGDRRMRHTWWTLLCLSLSSCTTSGDPECSQGTGPAADLCWAERAEAVMTSDSTAAIAAVEHIKDDRLHDIALLTIHKSLSEPAKRVEACGLIRGEASKKKCMTYEVRVHLWENRDQGVPEASGTVTDKQSNRPECEGLPPQFQDACELEAIFSRTPQNPGANTTQAPNAVQCLSIGDPEARALCQTEVAALLSRSQGLDAGVTACQSIQTEMFRNDCLLRVRANHPDAPVTRQQEICRMAGELFSTCQSMITISAAAHLLDKHGDKPVVAALAAIEADLHSYDGVLESTIKTEQTTFTNLSIWFRMFARMTHARYTNSDDLISTSRALVQIHDHFDATDLRRPIFRASMMRAFTALECRSLMRGGSSAQSDPSMKSPRFHDSDPRCRHPLQLVELLRERETKYREEAIGEEVMSAPLHTKKIDTRDWWTVYKTDMGMVPRSFVRACEMTALEADELAAMSMLSNGSWESNSTAFLAGLQSDFATVRSLTVHRLTRRLFNEWRTMPDQASTAALLKTWLPKLGPAMRTHVQALVDSVDQGSQSPKRFTGDSWCPDPTWPQPE